MKGSLNHIELHTATPDVTIPFYKELLSHFEWNVVAEFPNGLGMSDGNASLWFFPTPDDLKASGFNRDATGISHFGVKLSSRPEVEAFYNDYMKPKGIVATLDTPKAREDFGPNYYQVMFVDPEGLLIEVFTT